MTLAPLRMTPSDLSSPSYPTSSSHSHSPSLSVCASGLPLLSFQQLSNMYHNRKTALQVVQEYERAVIFRLGRLVTGGPQGPGIYFIIPCTDTFQRVDLRTLSFDVPPQEILTKDSVTVAVDAVVYFRWDRATLMSTSKTLHFQASLTPSCPSLTSPTLTTPLAFLLRRPCATYSAPRPSRRSSRTGRPSPSSCRRIWTRRRTRGG